MTLYDKNVFKIYLSILINKKSFFIILFVIAFPIIFFINYSNYQDSKSLTFSFQNEVFFISKNDLRDIVLDTLKNNSKITSSFYDKMNVNFNYTYFSSNTDNHLNKIENEIILNIKDYLNNKFKRYEAVKNYLNSFTNFNSYVNTLFNEERFLKEIFIQNENIKFINSIDKLINLIIIEEKESKFSFLFEIFRSILISFFLIFLLINLFVFYKIFSKDIKVLFKK